MIPLFRQQEGGHRILTIHVIDYGTRLPTTSSIGLNLALLKQLLIQFYMKLLHSSAVCYSALTTSSHQQYLIHLLSFLILQSGATSFHFNHTFSLYH